MQSNDNKYFFIKMLIFILQILIKEDEGKKENTFTKDSLCLLG